MDRNHKKPNENPSVGVILCASKEDEIVEYAMSLNITPALISKYTLKLIDKRNMNENCVNTQNCYPIEQTKSEKKERLLF